MEKNTIIYRVLELDAQEFSFKFYNIKNIINKLRRDRNALSVGKNWIFNFIFRYPELKIVLLYKYNY